MLRIQRSTIRDVAIFFGHFISSAPAVKLSMFFYGNIENENADALKT